MKDTSTKNRVTSYLSDRSQFVSIENATSDLFRVFSGMPQGSNLGPLLFMAMIDDIQDVLKFSSYLLFADDLKIYRKILNISDCIKLLDDINSLVRWSLFNNLHFNIKKCACMTYSRSKNPIIFNYRMNNEDVCRVLSFKDIGIVFDSRLTFTNHIEQLAVHCEKLLGFVIRTSKPFNSIDVMKCLFNYIVRTKLEYASAVRTPYHQKYVGLIE